MRNFTQVFARTGWLSRTPAQFRRALLSRVDVISLAKNESVYRVEDPTGGIYGVASGAVELHLPNLRDDRSLCHVAGTGYWFGDLSAVSGKPRMFEVRARDDTALVRLTRAEMGRLMEDIPEGWRYLSLMLADNLALALRCIEAMKAEDPAMRIRGILQNLVADLGGDHRTVDLAQDDIAAIAGLSRKSTNAALKKLSAAGDITVAYRSVRLNV